MRKGAVLVAIIAGVVCSACAADPETSTLNHVGADGESLHSSVTVQFPVSAGLPTPVRWTYMLQDDVAAQIAGTQFNVVVMDYTKDGTDNPFQKYTAAEMRSIEGDEPARTVLAYVSVGEAESYRYYFDSAWTDDETAWRKDPDAPAWLGRPNAEWEGSYKVRYWSEEWQEIILDYVDKIITDGFNGVYLDVIDSFEYWSDEENGEGFTLSEAEAAEHMIAFVTRIDAQARALDDEFLVIPQNGEAILGYDDHGEYLATIDGIGAEDLFYAERDALSAKLIMERKRWLDLISDAGKPVMVVDYVYAGSYDEVVGDFIAKAEAAGYFPYAAAEDREVDTLVVFPGQGE